MNITFTKSNTLKAKPLDETKLGFGKIFTDYMFTCEYSPTLKWHNASVIPYSNICLDPAAMVFHYGQEIFEGTKCYKTEKGYNLFRPEDNFKRLNKSADRLCMAKIPVEFAMDGLMTLLDVEKSWIPSTVGTSLYIRPTMIATDPFVGVRASENYLFYIILSPVGAYYANGLTPVDIFVENEYVRSVRGGTGTAKSGGNYAASILAGNIAKEQGFAQVLWLDGVERKYIDEVGAMNIMFVYENKIITPELSGSILEGITRDSILKLAKHLGYDIAEAKIPISQIIEDAKSGKLTEAFGTGTAAVISPVSGFYYNNELVSVSDRNIGTVSKRLYGELTGIQYGKIKDSFNWTRNFK